MDAWRPPKKWIVDLIEQLFGIIALFDMAAALLIVCILAA